MGWVPGVTEEWGQLGVPLDVNLEVVDPFVQRLSSFIASEFVWLLESLDCDIVRHVEKSDTEHTGELLSFLLSPGRKVLGDRCHHARK